MSEELEAQDRDVGGGFTLLQFRRSDSELIDEHGEIIAHFNYHPEWPNDALRSIGDAYHAGTRRGFANGQTAKMNELHGIVKWLLHGSQEK